MAEEFLFLGLGLETLIIGIIVVAACVATGYLFVFKVVEALRKYMDRYLGDHAISDGLLKLIGLSILVSALQIGLSSLTLEYASTVINPVVEVASVSLAMLRWGVYVAALLFIGFAIYHHATKVKGQ